ncbi:hypothetical protein CDAR_89621 [Caerostris darwini]|uniref:Uncharacterized protein n=1 Tax=Caerostris darwini TaxID=1538125 RepID=A0AAV4VS30_9ARAC|nr:hypothetical protein CDAR_89621 [Caerostris darwini]
MSLMKGHLNGQQNGQETLHGDFSQIPVLLQQASQKQCSHEKSAPNHHCDPVLPLCGTDFMWCTVRHKKLHIFLRECLSALFCSSHADSFLHMA